jgi:MYXO-CTERM domain-containing protein
VNVTNPLVTDSSATTFSSTSSVLPVSTAGTAAASESPSPNPGSKSSSHSSVGPIVGGIVAGVVALLLLLLLVLWRRGIAKRQRSVPGSKNELDLSEVPNGMIVEPFRPAAQAPQSK